MLFNLVPISRYLPQVAFNAFIEPIPLIVKWVSSTNNDLFLRIRSERKNEKTSKENDLSETINCNEVSLRVRQPVWDSLRFRLIQYVVLVFVGVLFFLAVLGGTYLLSYITDEAIRMVGATQTRQATIIMDAIKHTFPTLGLMLFAVYISKLTWTLITKTKFK